MKISVIIPSRLAVMPHSEKGNLWLDNALNSIVGQHDIDVSSLEVVVGLDAGDFARVPPRFISDQPDPGKPRIRWVESGGTGQARAVNSAVRDATGDVLAFLEDDDQWMARRLEISMRLMLERQVDMVTCSQREEFRPGYQGQIVSGFLRHNDFPTPSGWTMPRATWDRVGPLDESFRFHVDTEWLGRANRLDIKRLHLVDAGGRDRIRRHMSEDSAWLARVSCRSDVAILREHEPLVTRVLNQDGGMAQIAADPAARERSMEEHRIMISRYGEVPW